MSCNCKIVAGRKVLELPSSRFPRFLSGLTSTELSQVLSAACHREFHQNSGIIHEDDPADRMFLLISGHGKQFVLTKNGEKILLNWLTPGQIFGGAAIMSSPSRYLATTEIQKGSCALYWDRDVLLALVAGIPKLMENAFSIAVTEHISWLIGARVSLSTDDAQRRVARLLLSLACGIGKLNAMGTEIPVGNEDLASGASVTLFTVSRVLSNWQREGILRKGRGRVTLVRPELLALQ